MSSNEKRSDCYICNVLAAPEPADKAWPIIAGFAEGVYTLASGTCSEFCPAHKPFVDAALMARNLRIVPDETPDGEKVEAAS